MTQKQLRTIFFFALLTGVLWLTAMIFLPYAMTIAMAVTFAVILNPIFEVIRKIVYSRSIAAAVTVALTILLIALPLSLIATNVITESTRLYTGLSTGNILSSDFSAYFSSTLHSRFPLFATLLERYYPSLSLDIRTYIEIVIGWIASNLGTIFSNTLQTIFQLVLGIVTFFFVLRDGPLFLSSIVSLSPLSDIHDREILHKLDIAINSVIRGSLLIALLQGLSTGIGLSIFGIPNPTLWGFVATICALIPFLGAAITLLPAVIWMLIIGRYLAALGLFIWMLTAVGLLDNIIGTFVVARGVKIHPLFILLSVLGGVSVLGAAGFLVGPLILSLLYAMLDIYWAIYARKEKSGSL